MIGQTVSHYLILERLGGGGMGVVYKARDLRLDRIVALKFLTAPHVSPSQKLRFTREAKAASSLDHPNICTIYEIDETSDGQLFIVMAYYEGEPLRKKIERGPMPLDVAVNLGNQVAQGLAKAHSQGIVHRDVNPSNVIVTNAGVVKIVDFGIAKLAGMPGLTDPGTTMGTPAYMSPEQLTSEVDVDHRTDIWALGVVLYQMLTGRLPFGGTDKMAVATAILQAEPPPMAEARHHLPQELERIVSRAMTKQIDRRYQKMEELVEELGAMRAHLESITETHKTITGIPTRKSRRSRGRKLRWAVAVALLAAALAVAATPGPRREALSSLCPWAPAWFTPCALAAAKHVAVVPFRIEGRGPGPETFSDGLEEFLTGKLVRLGTPAVSLCVHRAPRVEEAFGVDLLLTGVIERAGERVRVGIRLVDRSSGVRLRHLDVEAPASDLPALQDRLVERIAAMLETAVTAETRAVVHSGGTAIPGAFDSFLQAVGHLKGDRAEQAMAGFRKALEQDPYYALAHAGLGEAYRRQYLRTRSPEWLAQAEAGFRRATQLGEKLPQAHTGLGSTLLAAGSHEEALAAFRRALAADPGNAEANDRLAAGYESLGRLADVEEIYRRAVDVRRNCWMSYNTLGAFYLRAGRYPDAAQQFQRAIDLAPDSPLGYSNLAVVRLQQNREQEAAQLLERSLAIQPRVSAYSNLGTVYFRQTCYSDAARMMESAIKLGQNNYQVWGNLAETYRMVPELADRAQGAFQKAIDLGREQLGHNPANAELWAMVANHSARLGRRKEAVEAIGKALRLAPKNVNVLFRAALVYEMTGERPLAFRMLEASVKGGHSLSEVRQSEPLEALRRGPAYSKLDPAYDPNVKRSCPPRIAAGGGRGY